MWLSVAVIQYHTGTVLRYSCLPDVCKNGCYPYCIQAEKFPEPQDFDVMQQQLFLQTSGNYEHTSKRY